MLINANRILEAHFSDYRSNNRQGQELRSRFVVDPFPIEHLNAYRYYLVAYINVIQLMVYIRAAILFLSFTPLASFSADPLRVFISVDMEGISGIGTFPMVLPGGKDYEKARDLMTAEVNAVVAAIFESGPAEIVINDSHGDHQNLHHSKLDPRVIYIQGDDKPFGMAQGLDESIDCAFFLGYHTRAGSKGFLAHTGTLRIKKLTLNGIVVGEGGLNAAFAGSLGVPVVLVSGDGHLIDEISSLFRSHFVKTKDAITWGSARLRHPTQVHEELRITTKQALASLDNAQPWRIKQQPVTFELEFESPIYADALEMLPSVSRLNGTTVSYSAENMTEAYKVIRFMYKYVDPT